MRYPREPEPYWTDQRIWKLLDHAAFLIALVAMILIPARAIFH